MEHPSPAYAPRRVVSPGRIALGVGAVDQVGEYARPLGEKALIVATEGVYSRYGNRVTDSLAAAGVETTAFTDVQPDPTVETVENGYDRWRAESCDVLVALGGGSPIDTAKAIGVLATNDGSIREFGVDRAGYEGVSNPLPPLIAVNTTAGTGAEATRSAVITDESTATKFLIVSSELVPDVAVDDPDLTVSLPRSHTAFTGIDALTHAIEAYVSVKSYSVPADFARNAIRRIGRSLPVAWANGDDIEARTDMMIAQLQAGQAFTNASVALVHGMARPLGARLHAPHGLVNGLLLPYVTEFSARGDPAAYAEIARLLGVATDDTPDREAAQQAGEAVHDLCEAIELTSYLDDFGEIPPRDAYLDVVGGMAEDAIASGSPDNNPRKPTREEIEELFVTTYDDALASDSPRRS